MTTFKKSEIMACGYCENNKVQFIDYDEPYAPNYELSVHCEECCESAKPVSLSKEHTEGEKTAMWRMAVENWNKQQALYPTIEK